MLNTWTWLSALALLVGPAAAQSCIPNMKDVGPNLARGRLAFQSSHYVGAGPAPAGNAVDGNCNGDWHKGRSCTHTNFEWEPWWYVDLGREYDIDIVLVKNRGDCCGERLAGAEVHVGNDSPQTHRGHHTVNTPCGTITDTSSGSVSTIPCNGQKGRYVSVVIPGKKAYLHVCEVEVYELKKKPRKLRKLDAVLPHSLPATNLTSEGEARNFTANQPSP